MRPTLADAPERTCLVGLALQAMPRAVVDEHLDELASLIATAGGVVVGRLVQERDAPDPATVIGGGLVEVLAARCRELEVRGVVFDEDLTASQVRNLERRLPEQTKVLDRAAVILDIFAQRARTSESQTQVELAQLNYLLPRLTRRWCHLSRQAGGIGTRGVGETQLEIDRRIITRRISRLRAKLRAIERDRRLRRRRRSAIPALALVGYTNAGKSSLLRRLTNAEVLIEDRLFATLDPRARRADLGDGVAAVLVDTVGFIRKLPHHLVAPFRSTLEEATEAELVLHVVDVAHPGWREQLRVGDAVLDGLGVDREGVLVVLNKVDRLPQGSSPAPPSGGVGVAVSALTGAGLDELRAVCRRRLLSAPGVAILRVPLELGEMVERAIKLPHQLARRFRGSVVELAMRVDDERLAESGLEAFLTAEWESTVADGG